VDAHAEREPDEQQDDRLQNGGDAGAAIIAMPAQVPPKNAFMQTTPGVRNSTYVPVPWPCAPVFEKSCP
jgi:hypothetical protein